MAINIEQNVMSSIEGATALKLDESYEIKNSEEQSALIDSFERNEENQIAENAINKSHSADEIPSGVSIESATYMENNVETENLSENTITENNLDQESIKEEYTPKLFSEENNNFDESKEKELRKNNETDQLFDQDSYEEEDFEIPAFLRRQKF